MARKIIGEPFWPNNLNLESKQMKNLREEAKQAVLKKRKEQEKRILEQQKLGEAVPGQILMEQTETKKGAKHICGKQTRASDAFPKGPRGGELFNNKFNKIR